MDDASRIAKNRRRVEATAKAVGRWIGRRSADANNDPRDCSGKRQDRRTRAERGLALTHEVVALTTSNGWWHCRACGTRATSQKRLQEGRCFGRRMAAQHVHVSHNTIDLPELTFCTKCGAYATFHGRLLKAQCKPATSTGRHNLAAISSGWHPFKGGRLAGRPLIAPPPHPVVADPEEETAPPPDPLVLQPARAAGPAMLDMAEVDPFLELDAWLEAEPNEGEDWPEDLLNLEVPWAEPPFE